MNYFWLSSPSRGPTGSKCEMSWNDKRNVLTSVKSKFPLKTTITLSRICKQAWLMYCCRAAWNSCWCDIPHNLPPHYADDQSVFHLWILFPGRKKTNNHNCWAPITRNLSGEVTIVINVVVGPHGSGTKLSDPAVLVGCPWWPKADLHAVMDRWPHSGPSAQVKICPSELSAACDKPLMCRPWTCGTWWHGSIAPWRFLWPMGQRYHCVR